MHGHLRFMVELGGDGGTSEEVEAGQRDRVGRRAPDPFPLEPDRAVGRHLDVGAGSVAVHGAQGEAARAAHRHPPPPGRQPVVAAVMGGLGDERHRQLGRGAPEAAELRARAPAASQRVGGGVRVADRRPRPGSPTSAPAAAWRRTAPAATARCRPACPASSEPTSWARPCAMAGLIVQLGQVAQDALVVVVGRPARRARRSSSPASCERAAHGLARAAHALRVGRGDGDQRRGRAARPRRPSSRRGSRSRAMAASPGRSVLQLVDRDDHAVVLGHRVRGRTAGSGWWRSR